MSCNKPPLDKCGNAVHPRAVVCVHCGVPLQPAEVARATGPNTGLPPNVAGALCYLFTWVTGLIFLLIAKDDEFVSFHAKQAIALGVAYIVLMIGIMIISVILSIITMFIPIIGGVLTGLLWFAFVVGSFFLVIFLMVSAYQGNRFKLPFLGDLVEKWQV